MGSLKFGFLLSVYKNDNPLFLDQCLKSIHSQTVMVDQTLVVVEGNIDKKIQKILNKYIKIIKGFKVLYIENQIGPLNYGLPSSLNYGMINTDVDYIIRIDSDDINMNDRAEKIIKFHKKYPDCKIIGSNIVEYDEKMLIKGKERVVPEFHKDILKYSKFRNPFNGPAVSFHRITALKLGGYPLVASNEDYCLWVSFLKYNYKTYNIQENLVKMRAGKEIIHRRSSTRYMRGEWQSIKYIFGIGYFNFYLFIFHLIIRTIIRLLPINLITKLYSKFLRK